MTDTPAKKWSGARLAIIGAACGLVYALGRVLLGSDDVPAGEAEAIAYAVGSALGGMLGGAILFAVVAAVWDRFVR
jgi:hypothetical protein